MHFMKIKICPQIIIPLLLLALLLPGRQEVAAQQRQPSQFDTLTVLAEEVARPVKDELGEPSKTALMAAAVPGLGQAYNRKYWKIPLVYGGFVVFASLVDFFNVRYVQFRDALILIEQGTPDLIPDPRLRNLSTEQLRRGRDNLRRDRDFNIILSIGWYGLTIADAVVDAHLANFNINDELALKITPGMVPNDMNVAAAGVKFTLYLKP